jgi:hypothetical protein
MLGAWSDLVPKAGADDNGAQITIPKSRNSQIIILIVNE